jgi:hypothetical protein
MLARYLGATPTMTESLVNGIRTQKSVDTELAMSAYLQNVQRSIEKMGGLGEK